MTSWHNRLARVAEEIDEVARHSAERFTTPYRRKGRLRIAAYAGHGTREKLYVQGRVLRDAGVGRVRANDPALRNLSNAVRRALPRPVEGARVRATRKGAIVDAETDDEGFFALRLDLPRPLPAGRIWHRVGLALEQVPGQSTLSQPVRTSARIMVPPPEAEFGIISDIDDTVVRTDATSLLRMARIVLLTNEHLRTPFRHVDSLYRALQAGPSGEAYNPIFYVSSSPWNFYDLLERFFRMHGIPDGPLFLRDWDISLGRLLRVDHLEHKLLLIQMILATHPHLPFVLIGDSGQQDPEIYSKVAHEHPERIRAIYIRDVTSPDRDFEVRRLAAEVMAAGVDMLPVQDTAEAAAHAQGTRMITAAALATIRGENARDEADTVSSSADA